MTAVLFGSISTVADTSELQREAFNKAFTAHDLDWQWSREDYLSMLEGNGGAQRIADYAKERGEDVDAAAVHASKSQIFQDDLAASGVTPRPGVVETIKDAKGKGLKVGLVTTTTPENISALLSALEPAVTAKDFDVIVDLTSVDTPKPDGAAYTFALDALGETAEQCVAVEDNVGGVQSAESVGVACVAFPNQNTAGHDFSAAQQRVDSLDLSALEQLLQR